MSKRTTGEVVVTGGGAIVVVLGLTLYMWLHSSPSRLRLEWDYPPERLSDTIFEIGIKTNLNDDWQLLATVVGTNRCNIPDYHPQAFFDILRTIDKNDTNNFLISRWYTNQYEREH